MKKTLFIFIVAAPITIFSQPLVITDADNLNIGTILKYRNCDETTTFPGSGGANKTWDFSMILPLPDTTVIKFIAASSAPHGSLFPSAMMVEELSTGEFLYISQTASGTELHGLVNTTPSYSLQMNFSDPQKISQRPISYGTNVVDLFSDDFTTAGYNFIGSGTSEIEGDGYGTLMLPGRTFINTMRVRISTDEEDTLIQFGSVSHFGRVTYKWYNADNHAPLFEIDSIDTGNSTIKTVRYLLDVPLTTGIKQHAPENYFSFYPNPANKELVIYSNESGKLSISTPNGIEVTKEDILRNEIHLRTDNLPNGLYILSFQSAKSQYVKKLIIQH